MGVPNVPRHVAIIMDGNGRWAKARRKSRSRGHQAGVEGARAVVESAVDLGFEALTLFAFSSENWRRPKTEVSRLLDLFSRALYKEVDGMDERGVRIRFVGNLSAFSDDLRRGMDRVEARTAQNDAMQLAIAVNYGGRWDLVEAARTAAESAARGKIQPAQVTEEWVSAQLALSHVPDPDLLIRTGGERRVSNFLLWQLAYAELYFTDTLWPDFGPDELRSACHWFAGRDRRFGNVDSAGVAVA